LNNTSLLRRFVRASRDFGLILATKVAYSKIRGMLFPALALPEAPVYVDMPREVSVLFNTAAHGAAVLDAVVAMLIARDGAGRELCICARAPVEPEMAQLLTRLRGSKPWIRIVTNERSVDDATAARWTIEQATGSFVALLGPQYEPSAHILSGLVAEMHQRPEIQAALLVEADRGSNHPASADAPSVCVLLVQRKSGYLSLPAASWALTAPDLARILEEAGVAVAYFSASQIEAGADLGGSGPTAVPDNQTRTALAKITGFGNHRGKQIR